MTWNLILSAAKVLCTAAMIVGVISILAFGHAAQARKRIAKYKQTGRFIDLPKIFSRW
jgi:hypothetical protein